MIGINDFKSSLKTLCLVFAVFERHVSENYDVQQKYCPSTFYNTLKTRTFSTFSHSFPPTLTFKKTHVR